jgi:hypothetical protein
LSSATSSSSSNDDLNCDTDTDSDADGDSDSDADGDSDSDADSDSDSDSDGGLDSGSEGGGDAGVRNLVCVFDIDSTLTCTYSCEAVNACKDMETLLAVNTAQSKATALANKDGTGYIDWGPLGFPTTDGKALDMEHGAFIFGMCSYDGSCSEEFGGEPGDCEKCNDCGPDCPEPYMGKAYGMSRIAKYYNIADDKCLVLFDDLTSNTEKVELFGYSAYYQGPCSAGWNYDGVYETVRDFLASDAFARCRK